MEIIQDGAGKGYKAKVNSENNLIIRNTSIEQHTNSAINGKYYEATTGLITLTDAVETGVLYLKNNESTYMVIDKFFLDVWASANGVGGGKMRYYKNPTVTGGSALTPVNTNFSFPDVLGLDLKGLTTMTGGTVWYVGYFAASSTMVVDEEKFCVPPGYGFGLSIEAPASNTSMVLSVNIAFYRFDINLI
jgi:hypothetical protein